MGMGPIPRSAIKAYGEEFGIIGDEFESFAHMIRVMDNEYLTLAHSKPSNDKGMTASADDPDRTRAVMEVIRSRAAAAKKKQVKRKTH